jgi:hypothetical protein
MTRFRTPTKIAATGLLLLGLAGSATAAEPAKVEGRAAAFQALLDCKAKADDAARLACYDAAAASLAGAEKQGDIVVVDRDQVRTVRRQAFGFSMPSLKLFDRGEKPEEMNRLTAKVAAASVDRDGKWVLRLEDGQTWRQVDSAVVMTEPKRGSTVEIRRASLGSFMLSIDGHPGFRVHRDD